MIEYRQYLSCNAESGEIGLCARVSSDSEKWVIYNDFLEGASSDIESGCCVVLKRLTGQYLTDSHERSHDGVLKLTGSNNDTLIVEPQIWRIMKSHASFLEVCIVIPFVIIFVAQSCIHCPRTNHQSHHQRDGRHSISSLPSPIFNDYRGIPFGVIPRSRSFIPF